MQIRQLFTVALALTLTISVADDVAARAPDADRERPTAQAVEPSGRLSHRNNCRNATSIRFQNTNNVRALLSTGGDVWWDGTDALYIVPNVAAGEPEVSSIYAGAVWLGGRDPAGNLKLAAQQYGRSRDEYDFYPGPLDPEGTTDRDQCTRWDTIFAVTAGEILEHQRLFDLSLAGEIEYTEDMIPRGVKGWPSLGNPYFEQVTGYALPDNNEDLAGFFDYTDEEGNGALDGLYDPLQGDFPTVEINGCTDYYNPNPAERDLPQFPDEMFFWIYNDAGNVHRNSGADFPLNMEVQVQSFAYNTNDALNDMTFQRYRLINRGKEALRDTYFAMWVDADLGCSEDDYVGCDTTRSLAYYYNTDPIDGITGSVCGGVPTYASEVPAIGIDYFRGPNEFVEVMVFDSVAMDSFPETIERELGMSSFTYVQRSTTTAPVPAGMEDPTEGREGEFYNLLSGRWRDGTPYTAGGTGYLTDGPVVDYAFPTIPCVPAGPGVWSAFADNVGEGDRRTIQASGPFTLVPGALNELIIGVPWVPDIQDLPGPCLQRLLDADDLAQNLFDNCFDITDGPNAPDIDIIELDQRLILVLTNDQNNSNNAFQLYEEPDLLAPEGVSDSLYRFEGYKVFQLESPEVTDLDDPTQARLIFQSDLENGIGEIYNWRRIENPFNVNEPVFEPVAQVEGGAVDQGISRVFTVTTDQFAQSNPQLVNHKPYYFKAVSYAYNNYRTFDPLEPGGIGQARPYLEGRRNIKTITGVPRPITDTKLNGFGARGIVRRLDGAGTSDNFLDLADGERERILEAGAPVEILYEAGRSPIVAEVFNPFVAMDGTYQVLFTDDDPDDGVLAADGTWRLVSVDNPDVAIIENQDFSGVNEYIVGELGVSISLGQVAEPGSETVLRRDNGCIGYEVEATEQGPDWFQMVPNKTPIGLPGGGQAFNFLQTDIADEGLGGEEAADFDLGQGLTECFDGEFVPLKLAAGANNRADDPGNVSFVTPQFRGAPLEVLDALDLADLNNVDLVFTNDKSKWSRCVVIETVYTQFRSDGAVTPEGDARAFTPRDHPSVSKEADANGEPAEDGSGTRGFGWFPGYALDVETGQRLNVFFGENSAIRREGNPVYDNTLGAVTGETPVLTGADMAFNPTVDIAVLEPGARPDRFNLTAGGQHIIYVTREPYDSCQVIAELLAGGRGTNRRGRTVEALETVTYAGIMVPRADFLSYADGLIPSEVVVKLRVNNPYRVPQGPESEFDRAFEVATGTNNGMPAYEFTLEGVEAESLLATKQDSILSFINVVPNPYYGYSEYEISEFSNLIRITNLPAEAIITIYSLDGKFIRRYTRAETPQEPFNTNEFRNLSNRGIPARQIYPDLDWDLKNGEGIPVASGTYLIHVDAGELGERTIKSFIIQRAFDPAGL